MSIDRSPLHKGFIETQEAAGLMEFITQLYGEFEQRVEGLNEVKNSRQIAAIKSDMAVRLAEREPAFALFVTHPDANEHLGLKMVDWVKEMGRLSLGSGRVSRPRSKTPPSLAA